MTQDVFEEAINAKKTIAQAEQVEKEFTLNEHGFASDESIAALGESIMPFKNEVLELVHNIKAKAVAKFEAL